MGTVEPVHKRCQYMFAIWMEQSERKVNVSRSDTKGEAIKVKSDKKFPKIHKSTKTSKIYASVIYIP